MRTGAEPVDDWSGAAAYARGADPAALDYLHPEAVDIISALQPAGWQEADGGDTLTFWLAEGGEATETAVPALARLGALGALEVSRERPGWEDAWRRFHKPRVVGRLYVRPPWYPARDDLLDVVVEAGLAFGTGGHASTRQCLEEIQVIPPGPLLDLGSGSGVVSFAALRLGFAPVCGVDIDPVAVHAAAGNAALNELSPTFLVGDATAPGYALPAADTVVANIALNPILRLARRFAAGEDGGAPELRTAHLLLAGLLVEQGEQAAAAFPGYETAGRRDDGTWLMLHLTSSG
ncbi:MAG: 50S ribosomal protein L11 methyltransferase [Actinobacteria bacterium]|nr:50S ribosomal protein L11 methyltransferase [Actinomycetota bacterium]